jgi:hypothetical protein
VAMPCGQQDPTTWFAYGPDTETRTKVWNVTLDGEEGTRISVDPQGSIESACGS